MKIRAKLIASVLVICLVFQAIHINHVVKAQENVSVSEETEYIEVSFAEFGVADGTYECPTDVDATVQGLNSLDGVSFRGNVKFGFGDGVDPTADCIRIGGTSNEMHWYGLTVFYADEGIYLCNFLEGYDAWLVHVPVSDLGIDPLNEYVKVQLDFTYINETDVYIFFRLSDTLYYEGTIEGAISVLGTHLLVAANSAPISLETIEDGRVYDSITFSDMADYEAGILEEGNEAFFTTGDDGPLYDTAFKGIFQFSTWGNVINIGGYWQGVRIQPSEQNLVIDYVTEDYSEIPLGIILAEDEAGVASLTETDTKLKVRFAFYNVAEERADVRIGVQVNDAYEEYFVLKDVALSVFKRNVLLYSEAGATLTHNATLKAVLTFSEFGLEEETTVSGGDGLTVDAGEGTLDGVSIEGFYQFSNDSEGSEYNYIYFGGVWQGVSLYPNANGDLEMVYVDLHNGEQDTTVIPMGGIPSEGIGFALLGEELKIKVQFDFENITEDGKADVDVFFIINDSLRVASYLKHINISTLGRVLFLWSQDTEHPLTVKTKRSIPEYLLEVAPSDYGIPDDTYGYSDEDVAVVGQLTNEHSSAGVMTMNRKVFSANIQFLGTDGEMIFSEENALAKTVFERDEDVFYLRSYGSEGELKYEFSMDPIRAGLATADDAFNLKISFEFIDYAGDECVNDVICGIWFEDRLYHDTYILMEDSIQSLGNQLYVICGNEESSVTIDSIDRTLPDDITPYILEDFGIETGIYNKETLGEDAAIEKHIDMNMNYSSISGRIALDWNADVRLCGKGKYENNPWEGYQFYINENGHLAFGHTCLEEQEGELVGAVTLAATFDTVQAGDVFDFTITQEILNADAEQNQDDIRVSIWLNGEMYGNRYFYLLDFADYVAGSLLIYPNDQESATNGVLIEDSVETEVYKYTSGQYGYLLSGKGDITVNQEPYVSGDVLTMPNDYIVRCAGNGAYVKKVCLYTPGDANTDGTIDVRDLVATKKSLFGMVTRKSAVKGADADGSSLIDEMDVQTVREVLLEQTNIQDQTVSYLTFEEDVMPIAGYYGPYYAKVTTDIRGTVEYNYLNDKTFNLIKEMGVNLINYTPVNYHTEPEQVITSLNLAEKYGIDMLVSDDRLNDNRDDYLLASFTQDYAKYASFKGIFVVDEPVTQTYGKNYWDNPEKYARLEHVAQRTSVLNGYSNLFGYINLCPISEEMKTTDNYVADYEGYVDAYIESCNPKMISFDYYVFDEITKSQSYASTKGYFQNLSIMRKKSLQYNIPFWSYIQAGSYWNDGAGEMIQTNNTTPTKEQMRWNVNTCLAYGTKGIQYFTLVQPYYFAYQQGGGYECRNGLIGVNGELTQWGESAMGANAQVAAVDHVLLHAKSKEILWTGYDVEQILGDAVASDGFVSVETEEYSFLWYTRNYSAIVGAFEYQGKPAYYVVNYDTTQDRTVTLNFQEEQEYSVISEQLKTEHSGGTGDVCELHLEAGGAALVLVQ